MSLTAAARNAVNVPIVSSKKLFIQSRTILPLKWKWERKTETNDKPNPKTIAPNHLPLLK